MVKVCHITSVHGRYDQRIFKKECTSVAEAGYDVTLIVNDQNADEIVNNVKIVSIGRKEEKQSRLSRIMSTRRVLKKAIEVDADIYHFHDPELLLIAKNLLRRNKKVIFDSHEVMTEQIRIKGYLPQLILNMISKIYYRYENHVCKRLSAVIYACPLRENGNRINPFEGRCKITVCVDNYPLPSMQLNKKEKEENGQFTLCYAGGLTEERGITNLVKASAMARCKLILAGKFPSEEYKEFIENMEEFKTVDFRGQCSLEEVYEIYSYADAGASVLLDRGQYLKLDTLPVKIFEFFQMGLPAIISDYPYARELNEKYPYGYTVNPDDANNIADAIKKLASGDNEELKKNGRFLYENFFSWEREKEKIFSLYETLMSS